ncbi:MAG: head-tail adaptor protein [Pseudomonadota bacterium]
MGMLKRASRLVLESQQTAPDGGGGLTIAWAQAGVLWGEIEPRSGSESAPGARPTARVTHRIRLRREPGSGRRPRPDQRLRLGERIFAIHGVADTPDGEQVLLWVEEGPLS